MSVFFPHNEDTSKRLDVFLKEVTGLSRSQIKKAIEQGLVKVDDKITTKVKYKLKTKEKVTFIPPPCVDLEVTPEPIALDIIYEDSNLVIINKPSGLVVHPGPGHYQGTLVHGLIYHYPNIFDIGGVKRAGIVHRLDKDTSGIIVVAKSEAAHQGLSKQFRDQLIKKQYLALIFGVPEKKSGLIELPLGRHPKERKKISVKTKRPRLAITLWQIKERFPHATLLLCEPKTGRTHQIRVHLATIGLPILGDPIYFHKKKLMEVKQEPLRHLLQQTPRLMLHAWKMEFIHPIMKNKMKFETPLPEDMVVFMDSLKKVKYAKNCYYR